MSDGALLLPHVPDLLQSASLPLIVMFDRAHHRIPINKSSYVKMGKPVGDVGSVQGLQGQERLHEDVPQHNLALGLGSQTPPPFAWLHQLGPACHTITSPGPLM
jgi:hypothetical protein